VAGANGAPPRPARDTGPAAGANAAAAVAAPMSSSRRAGKPTATRTHIHLLGVPGPATGKGRSS